MGRQFAHIAFAVPAAACCVFLLWSGAVRGQSAETIGEGDSVRVTVFQVPDLNTEARVSERGTITFPLIGEIAISGLNPAGAEAKIAAQLAAGKFVTNPQVSVSVTRVRSRQVLVLGQVARPGRYPLEDAHANLTDLLALAGGIVPGGDETVTAIVARDGRLSRVEVDVADMYRSGDLSRDIRMQNGDTIFVRRAPVFYIYGEVQRAGAYRLEPGMTVMQALSVGGGITPRGTERGIRLYRREAGGPARKLDVQLSDAVQPDDVIQIRESLF